MEERHWGVGVVITQPDRQRFLVQEKDDAYPFPEFRRKYSFIGGEKEAGEHPNEAVVRESREELRGRKVEQVVSSMERLFDLTVRSKHGPYYFSLYESVVSPRSLERLVAAGLNEGIGHLVSLEKFRQLPWVWNLDQAVNLYLLRQGTAL